MQRRIFRALLLPVLLSVSACDKVLPSTTNTIGLSDEALKQPKPELYPIPFKTTGNYLSVYNGKEYKQIFMKGVNLSVALPGTQAGELEISKGQYLKWFKRMGEIGINTIRLYTLHRPAFYEALEEYNLLHKSNPLYVLHGIWYDENEAVKDLYTGSSAFTESISEVVNCVHGNNNIGHRFGRAYGVYKNDISPWVIGWLIGREFIYDEALTTNANHPDKTIYQGKSLKISNANATETWITQHLDELINFERDKYKVQRPVSMSSWPTLDPITHPTEPVYFNEDRVGIDVTKIEKVDAPAGIFASYHAYPYYPNFMSDDPNYKKYTDEQGLNSYLGYLTDLKAHYQNMPLVIAEFGVPTSWGDAHTSPTGMNHGGMDEYSQGKYDGRMMKNIYDTKAGGGILFAWIDEWWKRTWIADELAFPKDRYRLWHNITSPEQNFGLISFETEPENFTSLKNTKVSGNRINNVEAAADATFFNIKVNLNSQLANNENITIGFDTYRDDLGESILPNKIKTSRRSEFALNITNPNKAQLFVTQDYDLVSIWHRTSSPNQKYHSTTTDGQAWNLIRWKNDQSYVSPDGLYSFPEEFQDIGNLRIRNASQPETILDAVVIDQNTVNVRIPWTLLQFTDPTTLTVMDDNRATPERETARSEGIGLSVSFGNDLVETERYKWSGWNSTPVYKEKEKKSMEIFSQAIKAIPGNL